MFQDTSYPMRTLTALKLFVAGFITHVGMLFMLNEKGQTGVGDPVPAAPASTDWKAGLPEDIKADPIFEKYKEPAEAFRALVGAQKFLGREKLPVPADENDKETYDIIFKRLGLPDNDAGYELPTDLEIPKELPIDEAMLADFRKIAHENGILPSQFKSIYKWYMQSTVSAYNRFGEERKASQTEVEAGLRKEWGAAYGQNIALAKKVFSSFADDKMVAEIEKGLGNNPVLIKLFANIGKVLSEDQLTGKPGGLSMTPAEAMAEIKKMEGDMKSPLFDEGHPQHAEYVEKRQRLYQLANS